MISVHERQTCRHRSEQNEDVRKDENTMDDTAIISRYIHMIQTDDRLELRSEYHLESHFDDKVED